MQSLLPKTIRGIAMVAVMACGLARGADTSQFDAANKLYETQKYAEAKQGYEALVKSGPWSANLFYNLGNAEWKLGNGGAAVVDYERALELEPAHPEARANLDFVRNATGARLGTPAWWQVALSALDANAATVALSVCGWVGLFCLAIALLRTQGRVGPIVTLVICVLAGGYAGGCLWQAGTVATRAVVVAKTAQAREAPADVAPLSDVLPAGTEVLAPEERGPWTYCTLPNGTRAWVPTDTLERVDAVGTRPG